jgi:hypothetical protein
MGKRASDAMDGVSVPMQGQEDREGVDALARPQQEMRAQGAVKF